MAKWKLVLAFGLFASITMTGAGTMRPDLVALGTVNPKSCEEVPYDVVCRLRDGNSGGHRYYCYYSLCEAEAAGAFSCKPASPVCEPH